MPHGLFVFPETADTRRGDTLPGFYLLFFVFLILRLSFYMDYANRRSFCGSIEAVRGKSSDLGQDA
jgi:hypothetical protein